MDSEPATPSIVSVSESEQPQALELEADEEEYDELNSDDGEHSDDAPLDKRMGESLLPSLRLEGIIQAHGVMGSLALSKEALFVLSVATEEFIKRLAMGGQRQASVEGRNSIIYRDMAATTEQYQEFMFLRETIPTPVSLSEALQLRELHEKEMLHDDPALATPTTLSLTAVPTPSTSKPKAKKAANGKDKQNRNGNNSSRAQSQVRWDYEDVPPSNDQPLPTQSSRGGRENGWTRWPNGQNPVAVAPQHNGHATLAPPSVNGQTPVPQHPNYWQRSAASPWASGVLDSSSSRQPDSTSAARTQPQAVNGSPLESVVQKPASAVPSESSTTTPPIRVAGGSGGPSSSSIVAQNPGRTIYSQTKSVSRDAHA